MQKLLPPLAAMLFPGLLAAASIAPSSEPVRRIVVFRSGVAPAAQAAIAGASGRRIIRSLPMIDAVAVAVPETQLKAAEVELRSRPEVKRVDEDPRVNWLKGLAEVQWPDVHAVLQPFAKAPRQTPVQKLPWGIERVKAPAAWSVTKGQGAKVCVIDTGIDYNHPNLKANIKGGWNAVAKNEDFLDDNGHGSHVTGTIAAAETGSGVVGVAPKASLYGVKVLDAEGSGTFDDVIAGMQWAVDNRMDVASMSLGASQGNESLKAAVEAMVKNGVVLVAAAGNEGPGEETVSYPGGYPGAIAVAASDPSDRVADFSSRGPAVALIAPGAGVYSTYMNGGYETLDGTSMATPHVSGLAALLISAKGVRGYEAVRAALVKAAAPLKDAAGKPFPAAWQGAGLVDAAELVE
ncbi:MAG: S8 family peptidase [Elusimicrobia bacterium]|nr:S8 family peptidase [Elusimicrobiota bacterium]